MKIFVYLTPVEKIDHIEMMMANALPEVKRVTCLADILDVWDYWAPYMIERMRKLEAVAKAAHRERLARKTANEDAEGPYIEITTEHELDRKLRDLEMS